MTAPGRPAGRYLPGLDGLRAVAVAGVLAYHAGVGWAGGGLLGVDVFFVLSGFLITSLLAGEHQRTGRVSLGRFWSRRARRLLPALLVTLAGVAAYGRWFAGAGSLGQIRGDALSTLGYVANWHYVLAGQNYFVHYGAPSPLLHTWSLAVEEQFYLLWPLVAVVALRLRGRVGLGWAALAGAAGSAGLTAVLSLDGAGVSRMYYGTDTRAQELMVGCLLAAVLPWLRKRVAGSAGAGRAVTGAGLVGTAGVLWALHAVSGSGSFLYRGGFLAVSLATAAAVAMLACGRGGPVGRVLEARPVRYLGRISYGLYVYHWPLFLALDHAHTGLVGTRLLAVRLGATAALAVASFHLIEEPIRSGRFLVGRRGRVLTPLAAGGALTAMLAATTVPAAASVAPPASARARLGPAPAVAAPAAGTPPVRVLMVGDSMAWTLANGLSQGSSGWGVIFDNKSTLGCDLAPESTVDIMGQVSRAAQGCPDWPSHWAGLVAATNPDVVGVELGRWEVSDRLVAGRWTTIGDPAWDNRLAGLLTRAVDVLSSRGAKVVLFTLPYVAQNTEQPDGRPWPINLPGRTDAYNALVRRVVASRPGVARLVDVNRLLDPKGAYTDFVAGVQVRAADREHISLAGGELIRPDVLPVLQRLGLAHARARTGSRG